MSGHGVQTVHVAMTGGVSKTIADHVDLAPFVFAALDRHLAGDWGDLDAHDTNANNQACHTKERVLSSYPLAEPREVATNFGPRTVSRLWVITDAGWETTTILWPQEY